MAPGVIFRIYTFPLEDYLENKTKQIEGGESNYGFERRYFGDIRSISSVQFSLRNSPLLICPAITGISY